MSEKELKLMSGWPMLANCLIGLAALIGVFAAAVQWHSGWLAFAGVLGSVVFIVLCCGFIVVSPNEANVVQLFGEYVGTVKGAGFYYGNPFYSATKVSLRVQTFETGTQHTPEKKDAAGNVTESAHNSRRPTKVNDLGGTPIEVAAVVVWRVVNTVEAIFQVDDYHEFVHIQSEAALRNLVSQYPYDAHEDGVVSLRGNTGQVAEQLKHELQQRLQQAGVVVDEARISYLAYAPEIAAAMLQRQQAQAVVAARAQIVDGACGMVEMALNRLTANNTVALDDDRRAAMVSNLLVVLCGDRNPTPVVNAGTIYQ
jgi:regulator of protease activity HflC (stomatin/prohibitin superfamily)